MTQTRSVIITGGGAGIGRATALAFAAQGDHVIIAERDATAGESVAKEIKASGGSAAAIRVDVTIPADLDRLAETAGRADVLVNNAGIFGIKPFFDIVADDFRRTYEVNVVSVFELTRRLAPQMPEGAAIVNISSRSIQGAMNYAHYIASKSAIVGLTRAMALELADRRIRVNAVSPGAIKTEMLASRPDTDFAGMLKHQPLGRLGEPEDIAASIVFLASPGASFITGQLLAVDGGRSLGGPYGF
ncbi:MAG: short-chain dehydrogenase [Confluentimicrobium sp.]|jgi:3-oxoacyl-[acyl-carrier protein] reductase|uniref:SDR family NAD(P)-dependent oxidoreductase n=1 Tax=Actibacterium sp. TaxID=1872125 RepID=UPI000C473474|nr:SDR family oxidoreductase [Actibacterium sp.]MBC56565.1 short-chain dehydrogenase [Actibacterium sp.]|tara:strand:- start:1168 stop:1902 length:735 start_codon:yes stop_codon:yes gene_type:complete